MSLDVYLKKAGTINAAGSGIFIREDGCMREITRGEWDERNPGHEPTVVKDAETTEYVFSRNITHNLSRMADEASIYYELWRPEEVGITTAGQLIAPLTKGLKQLEATPEQFKRLNPENGWGDYGGLLEFVREYLSACKSHPDATIEVSR